MKKVSLLEHKHSALNEGIGSFLTSCDHQGIYIEFKLADLLKERNLTMRDIAKLSGLRLATISDFCTGNKGIFNLQHIFILMMVLRLDSISDLIDFHIPEEHKKGIAKDRVKWVKTKKTPEMVEWIYLSVNNICNMPPELYSVDMPKEDVRKLIAQYKKK